jgi:GntR family transcriptional regulator/MocR family aminotransferase
MDLKGAAQPAPGDIDLVYGPLAGSDFPTLTWMKAQRRVERQRSTRLEYDDPRGDLGLRKALQGHLSQTRGLSCSVGHLMIVNGSQQALDLCARLLVDAGAGVVVENPGYRMAHRVFEAIGARLLGVDVDEQGLKTDQLQKLSAAQVVYVTPTHQFPLGGLLPIARRRELLAWAAKHGTWVIEDDYDGEYRYTVRPEPTLLSLDTDERVIHIGTFSKTLSPTLRLGYMVLPTSLLDTFIAAKRLTDRHAATAAQRTLALLLDEGSFDRHVRRMRRQQHARQRALVDALEQQLQNRVEIQGAASGLHLVVWLKGVPVSEELAVATAALQRGVRVYPISPFYCSEAPLATSRRTAGLVVGYALLEPAAIREGVRRLAGALDAWAAQYKQAVSTIGL